MSAIAGLIEGWREVELGEVCEFAYGKSLPAKSRTGFGYPVYGSNGQVGLHEKSLTNGPTIVIGRKGSFGEVHFSLDPCSPIDTTYYITEDQTKAYLPWLARQLRCLGLDQLNRAAAIPGLNRTDAYRQKLLLPPLEEQKRIAGILDAADVLRVRRRESLAQLDTLLQSIFLDMFGDPVTNPMGWEKREVDAICRLVRGSSPRPQGDPQFYGGPVPRLMVADITRDGFRVTPRIDTLTEAGALKSRPVLAGTVVMAVSGNVGVVATVQVPCCVHDGFVAFLDLNEAIFDSCFLMFQFHFLKMTHERSKAGAIFQNLTTRDIKAMQIFTPPLELQQRFAAIVESVEQQKAAQRAHLDELDTLFACLQQRAFAGELVT